jgi:HK97 family phage major capsid protein
MNTFEAFNESNDEKLAELEGRLGGDVLTTEKVERISRALDEQKRAIDNLALKKMRPVLGRDGQAAPSEHKSAFEAYMRQGDDRLLRSLDAKAMSYGSGQDGGYLVPPETETEIGKRLSALSPIRAIASVRQVSAAVLKKPFSGGDRVFAGRCGGRSRPVDFERGRGCVRRAGGCGFRFG